jgi:dienelactone hydrolase
VLDESRSWANHPGFGPALLAAVERVRARRPVRRIAALGLSMGAFSALVAARLIAVDVVLAFGPQWSVVPGVLPGETRWSRWTAALPDIRWPTAPLPLAGAGRALICHGMADDLPQALAFPHDARADHILFPGLSHAGLVPHLKARGALAGLLEAALDGDRRRLLRITASAGGARRRRLEDGPRISFAPQEPGR